LNDRPPPLRDAGRWVLLGSVFVVAACGLVYELVAGAVSSYLMGDAVTQFSLVIGTFLCAMGVGAYLARFVRRALLRTFVEVEIAIGLIGGCSSIAMFAINAFAPTLFPVLFYALCASIGVLVGIEIPLLVRILRGMDGVREALSRVLALDYLGALLGALAFPLLALPWLGLSRSSVAFGLLNLAVAGCGITLLERRRLGMALRLGGASLLLLAALAGSGRLVGFFEDVVYQDAVILTEQSRYQRIVLTRWRDDVRLYLNGHIQFSSVDEARYHESLVVPAMAAVPRARTVLLLGGGDGLAAREVLKHEVVESLTLVDIDPVVTGLASTRPELLALNLGSLQSPRVTVVNTDAMAFLEEDRGFYDVILVDLPDPSTDALAKLYSDAFYALALRRLSEHGALATQATSPFYAPLAYWCAVETLAAAPGPEQPPLTVLPYHVHVPSFGEWGFVLATRTPVEPAELTVEVPTHFLTDEVLAAMFAFGKDLDRRTVQVNRLERPVIARYYARGWRTFE